jgi:hypothetical protein
MFTMEMEQRKSFAIVTILESSFSFLFTFMITNERENERPSCSSTNSTLEPVTRTVDLEPADYAWTTWKILEIADICCQGRVVSVLEGGYGKTPATANPEASQPLDKSMFSECAMRHVHAMIDPYDAEARFGSSSKE